ncbi:MAG TPA: hypothetical protein VI076_03315 [Actinopolymorphaceae bacterium]
METTATWAAGDVITVQEWWHGGLWSALPHVVVSARDHYVTFLPAGTTGTYASSIGVPGRDRLPHAERKPLALETRV